MPALPLRHLPSIWRPVVVAPFLLLFRSERARLWRVRMRSRRLWTLLIRLPVLPQRREQLQILVITSFRSMGSPIISLPRATRSSSRWTVPPRRMLPPSLLPSLIPATSALSVWLVPAWSRSRLLLRWRLCPPVAASMVRRSWRSTMRWLLTATPSRSAMRLMYSRGSRVPWRNLVILRPTSSTWPILRVLLSQLRILRRSLPAWPPPLLTTPASR